MKVLSLFDGMSCGRIALERAGIPVKAYYASEIDKYAQIVSEKNYPDIVRLGDVTKWREWKIPRPGMIIGGSPCQGFSFAGKGLNFEDPRSKLFFTFADIVKHYKPKFFLLENVKMKKEHQKVISDILGVEPVEINSALVSAQNRKRLYWTNIPGVTQPEDSGIFLRDIIEDAETYSGVGSIVGRRINERGVRDDYNKDIPYTQRLEPRNREKCGTLTTVDKDNVLILAGYAGINGHDCIKRVYSIEGKSPTLTKVQGGNPEPKIAVRKSEKCELRRFANRKELTEKGNCLLSTAYKGEAQNGTTNINDGLTWRKLTPLECERLQTVPDNYTAHVSNTQRYKMLGNGWTVDVIAHIFRGLKNA